jgi:EmrB/QacA subfamily drug resistance transporter
MQRSNVVLFVLMLGTLMGALDSTIVILAFPTITHSLNSNLVDTLWIILIYMLVVAVMTTPMGRIGDIYGRSRMFNTGFAIFTVGSLFCGFSSSVYILVLFRAVQALGGSLMQANSGAIVADIFPPNSRGRAFGFISLGFTSGAMLGIILGGVITTFVGWQYIFFINVPIGIIALFLGLRYLSDVNRVKSKIDLPGTILLAAALSLISYGAIDFATIGLDVLNLSIFILGIALIPLFVFVERKAASPMVDFSAFSNSVLRNSILAAFFQNLGYLAVVFLLTMYLQGVRGLSPLYASLLLIPGYIMGSLFGPFMGRLSDKYGARLLATAGIGVTAIAILVYLSLRIDTPLYYVIIGSATAGFGTSMFFPANNSAVMAYARSGSYGSISGLLRTVQNIGLLGSFVITISVAAASIPRQVAFEVFVGTKNLVGHVASEFIIGIDSALYVSLVLLAIAAIMSLTRGKEVRSAQSAHIADSSPGPVRPAER